MLPAVELRFTSAELRLTRGEVGSRLVEARLLVVARGLALPPVRMLRLLALRQGGAARGRLEAGGALLGGARALEELLTLALELRLGRVGATAWR